MGTRFRTMLAPINAPTGDGRRFAEGALSLAPTPFPMEWARERDLGHDGAVVVGVVDAAEIRDGGVWAEGEFFDDVDREEMPRLAEDVAEALKLIDEGVIGPSVDLDSFDGMPVVEGTDEPPSEEEWEDPDVRLELLVTQGRVRAGTLVSIPAFVETAREIELLGAAEDEPEPADAETAARDLVALVASVSAQTAASLPPATAFDRPEPDELTPITFDWETGEVYGHLAPWNNCHQGFSDVCVLPPRSHRDDGDHTWFNRFPVETSDGLVWAGRLTAGGRHPDLSLTASATMAAYDGKPVGAYVRVRDGKLGLWMSGVPDPGVDERTRRVLGRRKVSGDWRETADGLSLLEVLALSPGPRQHSEPGFPVATHTRGGRQVSLTASVGPDPDQPARSRARRTDYDKMADAVAEGMLRAQRQQRDRERAAAELAAVLDAEVTVEREAARQTLARALDVPVELLEGAS